ncbi:MAG: hypothetical protein WBP25_13770 [Giesbergeria sp.]
MKPTNENPMGYLAMDLISCTDDRPAIVVNTDARPIDLLAWCRGELRSLEATGTALAAVSAPDAQMDFDDFEAMFIHRLSPILRMVDVVLNELVAGEPENFGKPPHEL